MSERILLVEDDPRYASRLKKNLAIEGYEIIQAGSGEEALELFQREPIDLLLSDVRMPGINGIELFRRLKELAPDDDFAVPVIFLTSVDSVQVAVEAMKEGASDFITKDADRDEILLRIQKVLNGARVQAENRDLRKHIQTSGEFGEFVAVSPAMLSLMREVESVADSGASVLITGETGVGKELVARFIHRKSPRAQRPFIDINCAALPSDNLFQSEVFGHEKGAFTGASQRKRGKLELADGGILFLDEIGDMPLDSQGKILRALETQTFERLGGNQRIKVDISVIAATNKDLHREVMEGRFRQDLLYRLDIIRLRVPPLRERKEEILPLVNHYFEHYGRKYRSPVPTIPPESRGLLEAYAWPGNVRELKNLVERIVIRHRNQPALEADMLRREGLASEGTATKPNQKETEILPLEEMEKRAIVAALERTGWVQSEAAKLLDISPDRMHSRIKKFGIHHSSWRAYKAES